MQREDSSAAAPLSISSLPLELLAAIFGQLVSATTTTGGEAPDASRSTSTAAPDQLAVQELVAEDDGDNAMMEEEEEEDSALRDTEGEDEERAVRARSSTAAAALTRRRASAVEAVQAVLTASAVCSGWREILIKENALWKRLTLARWRVWQDLSWRTRRGMNWRAIHFQRVRRDREVPSLLALLARTSTHHAAMQRLQELGMDVWEKLTLLTIRWRRQPLQYLGCLHNATICMQALTEMRIKKEWERVLVALSSNDRNDRMLSGSDSDDVQEGMGNTSGTSSSSGSGAEDGDDAHDGGNEGLQAGARGNAKRDINIEEGAVLIASWERTTDLNVRRKVYKELDRIALTVRQRLAQGSAGGGGGVVEKGKETEGLEDERILHEINTTLYDHLGFTGNVTDYMNPNNSFIDRVLELRMGIPITLAVVYAAVCRRLNIRIDMIGMPGHFMVKYTSPAGREIFIDAFSMGRHLTAEDCRDMLETMGMTFFSPDLLRPVDHITVYERMLANLLGVYQRLRQTDKLLGVAKQLLILRGENSAEDLLTCGRLHMLLDQFVEARPLIQRVLDTSSNAEHVEQAQTLMTALESQITAQEATPPKRRPADPEKLRYRVGQVITHIRHAYRGVIYGWDTICSATPAWIREMRVDELPRGRNQPFYSVLVDVRDKPGNWTTYVAQENIELPKEARPVEHAQVGAFFTLFDVQGQRFVPNPELRSRYPDDNDDSSDVVDCNLSVEGGGGELASMTSPPASRPTSSPSDESEDDAAPMSTTSE